MATGLVAQGGFPGRIPFSYLLLRSIVCKVFPSPLRGGGDLNRLLLVESGRFRPRHASALCEHSAVLFDVMSGIFLQLLD